MLSCLQLYNTLQWDHIAFFHMSKFRTSLRQVLNHKSHYKLASSCDGYDVLMLHYFAMSTGGEQNEVIRTNIILALPQRQGEATGIGGGSILRGMCLSEDLGLGVSEL